MAGSLCSMNNHKPTKKSNWPVQKTEIHSEKGHIESSFTWEFSGKRQKKRRAKGKKSWIFYDHINPVLNCSVCSFSGEVYRLIRADISLSKIVGANV